MTNRLLLSQSKIVWTVESVHFMLCQCIYSFRVTGKTVPFSSIGGASVWEWVCASLLWLSVRLWLPAIFFLFSILFYSISFNCKWVLTFIELNLRSHMCTFRLLNVPFDCERKVGIQIQSNFLVSISPNSFFVRAWQTSEPEWTSVLVTLQYFEHQSSIWMCVFFRVFDFILAISRRFVSAFFISVAVNVATLRKGKRCILYMMHALFAHIRISIGYAVCCMCRTGKLNDRMFPLLQPSTSFIHKIMRKQKKISNESKKTKMARGTKVFPVHKKCCVCVVVCMYTRAGRMRCRRTISQNVRILKFSWIGKKPGTNI